MKFSVAASPSSRIATTLLPIIPLADLWTWLDGSVLVADNFVRPNHPPLLRGVVSWAELVALLRDGLPRLGWEPARMRNHGHFIHSSGAGLVVVTGCNATGQTTDRQPRFRSRTRAKEPLVQNNRLLTGSPQPTGPRQLSLLDVPESVAAYGEPQLTFFLMVHRASSRQIQASADPIRAEFNLPIQMERHNTMWVDMGYAERFPLARTLDAARVLSEDPDVVDFTFEIEERK